MEKKWLGFLDQLSTTLLLHLFWLRSCPFGLLFLSLVGCFFYFWTWNTLRSFFSHLLGFSLVITGPPSRSSLFFVLLPYSRVYRSLPLQGLECIVLFVFAVIVEF